MPSAACRRSSYELKIFGDTNVFPEYVADLRARAAGLPVRFSGAFDLSRAADVYGQIDVLVVPSLWLENSPLVIHEAFMAGVPVVGARIGGIVDLVEEGRNGRLYDPSSPAELAAVLRELIDAPALMRQLAAGVRNDPAGEIDRAGRARVGIDLRGRRQPASGASASHVTTPSVSIVVPTFNGAATLPALLDAHRAPAHRASVRSRRDRFGIDRRHRRTAAGRRRPG